MNIDQLQEPLEKAKQLQDTLNGIVIRSHCIILLGNGGSSAIASHIAEDYTKQLKKQAFTFSDPARLTCYANDYGYENAYVQFLKEFTEQDTLVILISSSGKSPNIIRCAEYCRSNGIPLITLSGFEESNPLNSFPALLKYHVKSTDYGIIENAHQIFLHSII